MSRSRSLAALVVVAVLALTGCHRQTVYSHYEHTPLAGWEKNDTLTFDVPPLAQDGRYLEELGLRISGTYPFMGLTLIVEQRFSPSGQVRSDTLNARLISHDGTIQGEGISYYQYGFRLATLHLHAGDSIHVSLRHDMKYEILPGIADVGLTLQKGWQAD